MRLLFENGGRGGMKDAEAVAGCLAGWTPKIGALYAEVGPQNSAWWFDKNSPQPVMLRSAEQLVEILKDKARYDSIGAILWAEAEALVLQVSTAGQFSVCWQFELPIWARKELMFSREELAKGLALASGRERLIVSHNGGEWRQALSADEFRAGNAKMVDACSSIKDRNTYGIELMRMTEAWAGQLWANVEADEIAKTLGESARRRPLSL